ncbi:MAG: cyclodeaminase/cyclohydrolase family protein [Acidobacteriaceae bacterium]
MTENHDASLWENSLMEFRNRVAAGSATPGGGAVAAVAATFAAALLRMVCAIGSARRPDAGMSAIAIQVKICEEQLAQCAAEDIRVFDLYMAARKTGGVPGYDDTQRCLLACTDAPLAAAEAVVKLEAYAVEVAIHSPEFLSSDVATAQYLLSASRKGLLANVNSNLKEMEDGEARRAVLQRVNILHGVTDSAG